MRARMVIEMIVNAKLYAESDTFSKMASGQVSVEYIYQTSLQNDSIVSGDNLRSLHRDIIKSTTDGQYSSLLHLFVAANILEIPIVSVFPSSINACINREIHNHKILPIEHGADRDAIHVMWTHTRNTDLNGWVPNHFVACVPMEESESQPSPTKSKT